jgi:hypothetical protein
MQSDCIFKDIESVAIQREALQSGGEVESMVLCRETVIVEATKRIEARAALLAHEVIEAQEAFGLT